MNELSAPILEVKNLTIAFPDEDNNNKLKQVVNQISFNLRKGEILGIVGESGSGKSLTSLAIMGLIPSSGKMTPDSEINYYFNHDLNKFELSDLDKQKLGISEGKNYLNLLALTETQKTRYRGGIISMIFQEPMSAFNPVYTIGFQLIEAIKLHQTLNPKQAEKIALTRLEEVKLPDPEKVLKKYPHELSGGQLQRVMIAMALSCNPSILIADEPTTALDVTTQKEILKLLKDIQKNRQEMGEEMSIIFISHDLGVINEIADQVLVMYRGDIREKLPDSQINSIPSSQSIFSHSPKDPYTKGLLACRPRLNRKLTLLPTVRDFMEEKIDDLGQLQITLIEPPKVENCQPIDLETEKTTLFNLTQSPKILTVEDLSVNYGKAGFWGNKEVKKAVKNVSFEVYQGETLGLVGESGCGKSTLARAILRLIDSTGIIKFYDPNKEVSNPKTGALHPIEILLSDYKLGDARLRDLRQKIQIIFQNPYNSLNPRMTIGAAILEPMIIHNLYGKDKQAKINKALELLADVGLGEPETDQHQHPYFNRYPHELSGGQRQRVCIARALALDPSLIICDESVSALDVSVQAGVLNCLKTLQKKKNLTYIFISHDLSVVRFMSDRIMVMKDGEAAEIPSVRPAYEIIKRDKISDYTNRLLNSIPTFPEDQ